MTVIESVYAEDFDYESVTPEDLYHIAYTLLNMELPVPVDLIARLHRSGIYIAH